MENFVYFCIIFTLVTLVYTLIIVPRRLKKFNKTKGSSAKGKNKYYNSNLGEVIYIIAKFKLDVKKINLKEMMYTMGVINAFIMSFVCTVVSAIPFDMIWQLLIGFVLLFGLIYSIYEIYGQMLLRRGWGKDEK